MKRIIPAAFALAFLSVAPTARPGSIGDPAPPITIERWIKGTPVKVGPGTNVFVVEFWATWCGPCKRSIPHLTQLQKEYANKGVIFIGVSDETVAEVAPFVANQGNNMDYRVGVDSSRRTFRSWMTAYGENGIPCAFIVNTNGIVVWHDFPGENLDFALRKITTGRFDMDDARNREAGERLLSHYTSLVAKPNAVTSAAPVGQRILNEFSKDWRVPYHLAKAILTDTEIRSRDTDLALRAATRATELTEDRSYQAVGIQARALFATGKKAEAVERQKLAISLCDDAEDRTELENFLKLYQKGAATAK